MKEIARSRETDSFDWEVEVTINEDARAPSLWQIEVNFDSKKIVTPLMTRAQVRLFCDALRRAILVGSVTVNPLVTGSDDEL